MKIYSITSAPSFGHELDDEKERAYKRWSYAYDRASDFRKKVAAENEDFNTKMQDLDSKISKAINDDNNAKKDIETKNSRIKELEVIVAEKEAKANTALEKVKINSQKNQEMSSKYNADLEAFLQLKNEYTEKRSKKLFEVQSKYNEEYATIATGLKANLVRQIIEPINKRFEENPPAVSSSIFISDVLPETEVENESLYQKILFWMVKLTNSNYGIVDAKNYIDKPINEFFENIKTILFVGNKMHETDNHCSITLLSNFQSLAERLSNDEKSVLKELFNKSSEAFHNSFVVISKGNSKLKDIFSQEMKLDKFFLEDERFGIKSFSKVLEGRKLLGKNLQQIFK